MTALHLAAQNDEGESVKTLLSNNADNSLNKEGLSAFHLAILQRKSNAALAFVQSIRWKEYAMETALNSRGDSQKRRPLLVSLVEELPDVMKVWCI